MFGSDVIRDRYHLFVSVCDDHFTVGFPSFAGVFRGRKNPEQPLNFRHGVAREPLGIRKKDARTIRTMLDLTENIGRAEFAIDAFVRDDERLGRAGEQVDTDTPVKLPLGLGHERVSRANQNVDRIDRLRSKRHRSNGLDPAEGKDRISARHRLRRDDRRRRLAVERRSACDDARNAGNLGGDHRHMRRGKQRIFAAWHITARGVDRYVLVAKNDTRKSFHLDVMQGRPLYLSEVPDLCLREFDVADVLRTQHVHAGPNLGVAQAIVVAVPAIELDRKLPNRGISSPFDISERGLDNVSDFSIGFGFYLRGSSTLQVSRHHRVRSQIIMASGSVDDPSASANELNIKRRYAPMPADRPFRWLSEYPQKVARC